MSALSLGHPAPQAPVDHFDRPAPLVQEQRNPDILPFIMNRQQYKVYRVRLWTRDPHCVYCGNRIAADKGTLDHILPKSQGGLDQPHNLILACEPCNSTKAGRTAAQWRDHLIGACERIGGAL
jgi:HNH endonuclease